MSMSDISLTTTVNAVETTVTAHPVATNPIATWQEDDSSTPNCNLSFVVANRRSVGDTPGLGRVKLTVPIVRDVDGVDTREGAIYVEATIKFPANSSSDERERAMKQFHQLLVQAQVLVPIKKNTQVGV